jgi:CRISPR/Cas system endoribonuclease Cas6 (RAMP superfamily)
MLFGKYKFFCIFKDEAFLPYYKGSTFRGVFGRALKNVVCALKLRECSNCLLRYKCIYSLVFETPFLEEKNKDSRLSSPPHPFVIEPPLDNGTHFKEGDRFDFQLLLFGKANEYLPYFIYAFERMSNTGIGKRINGKRACFLLEYIDTNGQKIYNHQDQTLRKGSFYQNLTLTQSTNKTAGPFKLKITIETPLRLKFTNRLSAELPFHVLVRTMLRRVSSLFNYYGDGEPDLDYRGMVKRAEGVHILNSNLHWFDWRRYSSRQDKSMLMGGMIGSIIYEGKIGDYLPLLDLCSQFHLGKQTSFGLGKINAEIFE